MKSSGFVKQTFRFITDLRFSNISFVLALNRYFLYTLLANVSIINSRRVNILFRTESG